MTTPLYNRGTVLKTSWRQLRQHDGKFYSKATYRQTEFHRECLERIAFSKGYSLVVDDFCPQGTSVDVARLHKEADRLLRGAGNQAGRSRMRPDGSLRPTYYPRGLLLSTGEDVPRVQSLRARMFILEFEPGDVDLGKLTKLQDAAQQGTFVMASYISYLARHMGELKLPARQRQSAQKRGEGILLTRMQSPWIFTQAYLGFYCFCFLLRTKASPKDSCRKCWTS